MLTTGLKTGKAIGGGVLEWDNGQTEGYKPGLVDS